ncbi:MAG: endolytic transglycosylase MltG [Deltaproteobacteria bacterium]|nr:MAG: endolytic transglycosylase MltG [Deltaproteobacteria bacterium]
MFLNKRSLRVCLFLFAALLFAGMALVGNYLASPRALEKPVEVVIAPGTSAKRIAALLSDAGVAGDETLTYFAMRLMAEPEKFKAGHYLFAGEVTLSEVLADIQAGKVVQRGVTFPEGYTAREMAPLLEEAGITSADDFVSLVYDAATPAEYGIRAPTLEGFLFPDTYRFAPDLPADEVIRTMVGHFLEVAAEVGAGEGEELLKVTTLASIVEKETGRGDERPLIASVFKNRLEKNMRLESDPTVIYGIDGFDGNIRKRDLVTDTPYNTYTRRGLPPGPIANPGRAALLAVLNPAKSEYLYFVSRGDGSHKFSVTFEEHDRAVSEYQLKRRKR